MWDGLLPLAQSHQVWGYVISFWYLLLHLNIYIFTQKLFSFISQLNSFIYHLKIKVPKSFQMICSFHLHRLYNILKKINKTTFSFLFNLSWLKYIIARGIWILLFFKFSDCWINHFWIKQIKIIIEYLKMIKHNHLLWRHWA